MMNQAFESIIKVRNDNVARFEKFVNKMNKVSQKLGFDSFVANKLYDIVMVKKVLKEGYTIVKEKDQLIGRRDYHLVEHRQCVYHIQGHQPVIEGWTFVARLEFFAKDAHPLVMVVPGQTCPDHFFHSHSTLCEHCHQKRTRKYAYVLKHIETGEYKQVGKSCLADFIRSDVNEYLEYFAQFWSVDFLCQEEDEAGYYAKSPILIDAEDLIRCMRLIKEYGFHSAKSEESTAQHYWAAVYNQKHPDHALILQAITNEEREYILSILTEGACLQSQGNSFLHNIKELCQFSTWESKYLGFLVAWLGTCFKKHNDTVLKSKQKENSYVGKIGDRLQAQVLMKDIKVFDSNWGMSYLHLCETESGQSVIFYSQKRLIKELNQLVSIKGSVKDLKEYQQTKQTVLTRVKLM